MTAKPFESERVLGMLAAAATGRNVRNASALYAAQAMRFIFPLILLPYLTTTLGPALWGVIAVGQSYGIMIERVIQYGFVLTGAREIAGARGDLTRQSMAVAGIHGTKFILALLVIGVTGVLYAYVPIFSDYPFIAAGSLFLGLVNGFGLFWYFQGAERMVAAGALDIVSRLCGLILVLLTVREAAHVERVLFALGSGTLVSAAIGMVLVYKTVGWRWPTRTLIAKQLHDGLACFISQLWGIFTLSANAFLMGFFAAPAQVGIYALAERIASAGGQIVAILSQVFFPKMAIAVESDPARYRRLWKIAGGAMGAVGIATSAGMFFAAPLVIPWLVDTNVAEAVRVTQFLALFPIIVVVGNSFGLLVLIVLKRDRAFLGAVVVGALTNIALIAALAPRFGAMGVAGSVVISNGAVVLVSSIAALRTGALSAGSPR